MSLLLGSSFWASWPIVYNPYHDALRLNPASIFNERASSAGLLIRNATLIDVVAGKAIPHTSLLIQGDSIAEVIYWDEPEVPANMEVYEAQNKFIMPGLIDVHVHLAMQWRLFPPGFVGE